MVKVTVLRDELDNRQERAIVEAGEQAGINVAVGETLLHVHDLSDNQARQLERAFEDQWSVVALVTEE